MKYLIAPESYALESFTLRSYREDEGALLYEAMQHSYEHLKRFMPWASEDQTLQQSEEIVRQMRGRYLLATDFTLAVVASDGKRLLGGTGFHLRDGGLASGNAEIGMWIRAEEAGKGLGTAVLEAMLAWGFSQWPWRRLTWLCDVQNEASLRVAKKAGMREEGVLRAHCKNHHGELRDTVLMAILREEFVGKEPAL